MFCKEIDQDILLLFSLGSLSIHVIPRVYILCSDLPVLVESSEAGELDPIPSN